MGDMPLSGTNDLERLICFFESFFFGGGIMLRCSEGIHAGRVQRPRSIR